MPLLEYADRCRRLAREVMGDPMEHALLRLAQECEAMASEAPPPDRAAEAEAAGD